jgi:DNA-binding MarR family transcriptional regulator
LQDTTPAGTPFPDDELRRVLQRLIRLGGLFEPHDHAGAHRSLSEMMALGELAEDDSMSQRELAQRLGLEKSTVSRLVAGLERRGWVERDRNPSNRRFYQLRLTRAGREITDRIGRDLRAHHALLLAELTPDEVAALTVGLSALARAAGRLREPVRDHPPRSSPAPDNGDS